MNNLLHCSFKYWL